MYPRPPRARSSTPARSRLASVCSTSRPAPGTGRDPRPERGASAVVEPPVEEVALLRDEAVNLGWAAEL